ncbi:MAG: L-aspartate oxidase, partial [Cyanobacteria bacterium P01_C01_bin.73]
EEVQRFKAIRQAVPKHVWQTAGVYRSRSTLKQGLADLQAWQSEVAQFDLTRCLRQLNPGQPVQFDPAIAPSELITAVETLNLLEVSALMLKSAAFREESRGGHFRVDFPKPDPQWHCHTLIEGDRITIAKVQS